MPTRNQDHADDVRAHARTPQEGTPITNLEPWLRSWMAVVDELETSVDEGLSSTEANKRLGRFGANRLRRAKHKSAWTILKEQFERARRQSASSLRR